VLKTTDSLLADLSNSLQKAISGQVCFDQTTRILYSTDASIYQIEPLGVVFPRDSDELTACVEIAAGYHTPILARGAGSSLAGQAIGPALIIDCSRYLYKQAEINLEEKTATVEPGVILASLNRAVALMDPI
jgi:FAD/FMN-containing dehydrogenase